MKPGRFASECSVASRLRVVEEPVPVHGIAEKLSAKHSSKLFCRALDILHVGAAIRLGCAKFVTGDAGQFRLAEAAGLRVTNVFKN